MTQLFRWLGYFREIIYILGMSIGAWKKQQQSDKIEPLDRHLVNCSSKKSKCNATIIRCVFQICFCSRYLTTWCWFVWCLPYFGIMERTCKLCRSRRKIKTKIHHARRCVPKTIPESVPFPVSVSSGIGHKPQSFYGQGTGSDLLAKF